MADKFCYSGAGGTGDGSSWTNAYTTIAAAISGAGAGGRIWLAHNHSETLSSAITAASTTTPLRIISCDQTIATATYRKATAAQFSTSGVTDITVNDAITWQGVYFSCGDDLILQAGSDEVQRYVDCTIEIGTGTATGNISLNAGDGLYCFEDSALIISDNANNAVAVFQGIQPEVTLVIKNMSVSGANLGRRGQTGTCYFISCTDNMQVLIDGLDVSGLTAVETLVNRDASNRNLILVDRVKLSSGMTLWTTPNNWDIYPASIARQCDGNNYGLLSETYTGKTESATSNTRTNGATDGDSYAWKITTTANCIIGNEYYTPWIPVYVGTTGSKTFTVYIANATGDVTDAEAWIEVEYLGTTASTLPTYATDRNTNILAAGTAQTDDTTSTWVSSLTFMQTLSKGSLTVNKAGYARVRAGFCKASATIYMDPEIEVV